MTLIGDALGAPYRHTADHVPAGMRKPRVRSVDKVGMSRTKTFRVTIADDDLNRWREAAKRQGVSLEQWLREAAELAWLRGSTR